MAPEDTRPAVAMDPEAFDRPDVLPWEWLRPGVDAPGYTLQELRQLAEGFRYLDLWYRERPSKNMWDAVRPCAANFGLTVMHALGLVVLWGNTYTALGDARERAGLAMRLPVVNSQWGFRSIE